MYSNSYIIRLKTILGASNDSETTYEELMAVDNSHGIYDEVYVVHYEFGEIGNYPLANVVIQNAK